ncbi:hypothetical protein CDD81_3161 [Ophiocordyceps australis]|uniref:Anaphase-promoting complex subunit 2 n=1 Tax=Ophiocordyceps australis TaxID=1399860 RepID=A0A2C5XXX1_9HYPO|nr:hypothetical protein CDD81_3161 [Ophiocordyceps australis]
MATASALRCRRNKIFRSVFSHDDLSPPTPHLVPTSLGESFGGHFVGSSSSLPPAASHQVQWDRAWHTVTSRLQLPSSVTVEDSFGTLPSESQDAVSEALFHDALGVVVAPSIAVPAAAHTEDILTWHIRQVRQHFFHHVMPLLSACSTGSEKAQIIRASVETLEAAHRQYLHGLTLIARGINEPSQRASIISRFKRDLLAVVGNAWTWDLKTTLRATLQGLVDDILGTSRSSPRRDAQAANQELLSLLGSLVSVGLAGHQFQVLFAEIMDRCMRKYIHQTYSRVWTTLDGPNRGGEKLAGCMDHLNNWIENQYGRLAGQVYDHIGGQLGSNDFESWRDVAVGRLATLRINELFDIILEWPHSKGGLEDLRASVTTPQRRLQLTQDFSVILKDRLLQPSKSTLDILQTYMSMIRTFHALDSSKVLLDRVVHALQLYLCRRDDAIRIVVEGLLANPDTSCTSEDQKSKLGELAAMLNDISQQQQSGRAVDEDDLDWDDMAWVPDPADAGVNYKRPKNEDVTGTLIKALGSQEIFIREFQIIMAERLLSSQTDFKQEGKVLLLLKKMFGDNALQNCDVMIKDMMDSRSLDDLVVKSLHAAIDPGDAAVTFHSKILSRLFWPGLPRETFQVPRSVAQVRHRYEAGFEQLKSMRKLDWLEHLGSAMVRLDLQDRTIELECRTYEAAVIYAFADNGSEQPGVQRSFNQLWQDLKMDEDLLEAALDFWISKQVLRNMGNQTYTVLEQLSDRDSQSGDRITDAATGETGEERSQSSPRKPKSINAAEQQRRTVYWQYIVGMLTNSSPMMPLGQILMMMKMLIADGCSWSNEELQAFLGEKVLEGELEMVGGKYKLAKK